MAAFLSFTVVGVVYACVYALTASGLVVTYTTSGIFNFAHGAIGMAAAYTYWQLSQGWHWPVLPSLLLTLLVLAPLFGALVERVLIRPLHGAAVDLTVVVTLGLLLALIGIADLAWKPTTIRTLPEFFVGHATRVAGFAVTFHEMVVIGVAVVIAVALRLFFVRTRTGVAMRAVVDNPDLLAMAGGPPARVQQLSWALGAFLASLAGILLAPIVQLTILQLTLLVINGYAAAMVGRLRSLPLTIVGALVLGLGQTYLVAYAPGGFLSQVQLIIPMVLLFVVLVVLPQDRLRMGTVVGPRAPSPAGLRASLAWAAVLVVAAAAVAPVLSPATLLTASRGLALAFVLLSLVLLTGYAGMASLCQMTFVGVGAFAMAKVGTGGSLLGLLAAAGLAAAFGVVVALPTLRLRGLYLALATLAFAQAMDTLFFTQVLGTGGSLDVPRPHVPGLPRGDRAFFVELAVVFAVASVAVLAVRRGRWGRRLAAVDDSPAACATLGVNINWTKLAVFGVSAALAGLGGALYGAVPGQVSGNDFVLLQSLVLLLLVRVGGVNTVTGAFLGAAFFAGFQVLQGHLPWLGQVSYLLTGLAGISLGRDPNGLGGRVAEVGRWLRRLGQASAGRPTVATVGGAPTGDRREGERLVGV